MKKLGKQISAGESFGSSVHNTLKKWGELELAASSKQLQGSSAQTALFTEETPAISYSLLATHLLELWHKSFIVEGHESRAAAEFARREGDALMRQFYDWWASCERTVLAVEQSFSLTLQGQQYAGRIDRVERTAEGIEVIDFKTGGVRTQEEVDSDLQLSLYALAVRELYNEPCAALTLLFLSEDGVVPVQTLRNEGQLRDAAGQLAGITERILQKDFRPTPSVSVCRHCPYRGVCDAAAVR